MFMEKDEVPGSDQGDREVAKIRRSARKKIGGPRGRPPKDVEPGGNPGDPQLAPGDDREPPRAGAPRPEPAVVPEIVDPLEMVDFIKSYRELGHQLTSDAHWVEYDESRLRAASQSLARVTAKMPERPREAIRTVVSFGAVGLAMYAAFGAPIVLSVKKRQAAKKALEDAEREGADADQPA